MGGFAPRFLIEAGFLLLLGVGSGFVAVLAGGWLLVSLVELTVWRVQARPVLSYVPPLAPEQEPRPAIEQPPPAAELPAPDVAYPLRADAGSEPSAEIEAYTRVIEDEPAPEPRAESQGEG
jgi:hypothetical protein